MAGGCQCNLDHARQAGKPGRSAFCRVDKDYRQAGRASDHDELDFRVGCVFLEAQITFAEIVPLVSAV